MRHPRDSELPRVTADGAGTTTGSGWEVGELDHFGVINNGPLILSGKDAGPGTEAKEGLGKDKVYPNPEFFKYNNYSYFDIEKDVVDSNKRVEQPKSGLTEFW